jgi:hypothetical protein
MSHTPQNLSLETEAGKKCFTAVDGLVALDAVWIDQFMLLCRPGLKLLKVFN